MKILATLVLALLGGPSYAQDREPHCEAWDKVTSYKFRDGLPRSIQVKYDVNLAFVFENFEECSIRSANLSNLKVVCESDTTTTEDAEENKQSLIRVFGIHTDMAGECGLEIASVEESTDSETKYCVMAKGSYRRDEGIADVLFEGCSDVGDRWVRFTVSWP